MRGRRVIFDHWFEWLTVCLLALQWGMGYAHRRRLTSDLRGVMTDATRASTQTVECWRVLNDCSKVFSVRDDFDSRHMLKLIGELAEKHRKEEGFTDG